LRFPLTIDNYLAPCRRIFRGLSLLTPHDVIPKRGALKDLAFSADNWQPRTDAAGLFRGLSLLTPRDVILKRGALKDLVFSADN
jgi:hypothetical protein